MKELLLFLSSCPLELRSQAASGIFNAAERWVTLQTHTVSVHVCCIYVSVNRTYIHVHVNTFNVLCCSQLGLDNVGINVTQRTCKGCNKKCLCLNMCVHVSLCVWLRSQSLLVPLWRWIAFYVSTVYLFTTQCTLCVCVYKLEDADGFVCVRPPSSSTECVCLCPCQVCALPALAHWHHPACPHHGKYRLSHSACCLWHEFLPNKSLLSWLLPWLMHHTLLLMPGATCMKAVRY